MGVEPFILSLDGCFPCFVSLSCPLVCRFERSPGRFISAPFYSKQLNIRSKGNLLFFSKGYIGP